jgi:hypothetical protein
MEILRLIGVGMMVLGAICALIMVRALSRRKSVLNGPVRTEATVLRLDLLSDDDDGPSYYYPWVRYQGADGTSYEQKLPSTRDTKRYAVGAKVPILYERNDPANLIDSTRSSEEGVSQIIMLILSGGLFLMGCALALAFTSAGP